MDILEHIISTDNLHYLLAKSTLGVFYKMIGQLNEGIAVLLDVANSLSNLIFKIILYSNFFHNNKQTGSLKEMLKNIF